MNSDQNEPKFGFCPLALLLLTCISSRVSRGQATGSRPTQGGTGRTSYLEWETMREMSPDYILIFIRIWSAKLGSGSPPLCKIF